MFAVTAYTAKALSARAAALDIAGRSSMKKDELYAAIVERLDTAHGFALEIDSKISEPVMMVDVLAHKPSKPIPAADLLAITGWRRLPRKYKKSHRKAGRLA